MRSSVVSASSSRRCLHNYFNAMLCLLKSVNETCYVYVGAIIFSDPFWLMVSKGLLIYALSRFMPCLILQGLHEEGECRQLEFWTGNWANIRDLFCITSKVLKLHGAWFWIYKKYWTKKVREGGHQPGTRVEGAPYPLGAPLDLVGEGNIP